MNRKPFITVLIIAYNRREFIKRAIGSVLSQTLDREEYEVIVIKNYRDELIDKYMDENNIKNIYSEKETLGGKLADGSLSSKGEVICFLEDDDIFFSNKLEEVFKKFKEDEDLVYLHNRCKIVDDKNNFIKLGGDSIDFNLSSISIRKSTIYFDLVNKLTIGLDSFIFFNALDSGKLISETEKLLTVYMFHQSSSVFKGTYEDAIIFNYSTAKEFVDNINKFLQSVRTQNVRAHLLSWRVKFVLNCNIFGSLGNIDVKEDVKLSQVMKFLFSKYQNNLSFKSRAIKILEYYAPNRIKNMIEFKRFKSGQRPT
ncbi:MAG: glycosyltransferase family 2 protein [Cuniculiplasma sp.]